MSFSSIPAILRILRIHKIPREPLRGALAIFASCFLWSCESRSSVEVASEEGILIMGNSGEPKGLDPHIVSGVLENNVIRSLFEGLGGGPSLQRRGRLARRCHQMVSR